MNNKLTKNIGIKIASLLFAAIMWVIVTNLNDPLDTRNFDNVPVGIINTHLLEQSSQVYAVLEGTDVINRVTVRAPRSVISRINASNIVARADLNDLSSLDTVAITLNVDNASATEINDIFGSSNILKLEIEDRASRNIPITPNIVGEITDGYMWDDAAISINPTFIRVVGFESVVNEIRYASFSFDINGITTDIRTTADVHLFDEDWNRILTDRVSQDMEQVAISIPILETKRVPIHYTVTGTPANGFRINGDDLISRSDVYVAGSERNSTIHELTEIVIPGDVVDLSDATETLIKNLNLNDYLPSNIRLVNSDESTLRISIGVEEEASRPITLQESQLRIINVPDGFQASLGELTETQPINLIGLQRDLNLIIPASIIGEIDVARWMANRNMAQLNEGNYQIPVEVSFGSNITVANTITVLVHFSEVY
ncbi:MAG: CdaR family protein [Lachnospiraceae bacterium]|nr:CdaR family protein [Lachnospiraceae bacterium]